MRRLVLAALAALLLALGWLLVLGPFVERDRCLDAGGAWRDGACLGASPGG